MGALQTHLSLRHVQKPVPRHPEIGERKQRVQLRRVLHQAAVAHLDISELALDHPKWMFDLGPRLGGVLQGSCRVSRVFKLLFSLPAAPSLG